MFLLVLIQFVLFEAVSSSLAASASPMLSVFWFATVLAEENLFPAVEPPVRFGSSPLAVSSREIRLFRVETQRKTTLRDSSHLTRSSVVSTECETSHEEVLVDLKEDQNSGG